MKNKTKHILLGIYLFILGMSILLSTFARSGSLHKFKYFSYGITFIVLGVAFIYLELLKK